MAIFQKAFLIALIPQAGNGPALVQNLALHQLPVAGIRTNSFCKSIQANSLSQQKRAHLVELNNDDNECQWKDDA
jgi:hypothetical protein